MEHSNNSASYTSDPKFADASDQGALHFSHLSLVKWSLPALIAGLTLGMVGHFTGIPLFFTFAVAAKVVGDVWIAALQMVAFPLVIVLVLSALIRLGATQAGALGIRTVIVFVAGLVLMSVIALSATWALLQRYAVDPAIVTRLTASITIPVAASQAAAGPATGSWIDRIVPRNIFDAAARRDIFPVLLFTMLFGLAVSRIQDDYRIRLTDIFEALAQTMLTLVSWMLMVTPIGVFALTYVLALRTGGSLAGLIGTYFLTQISVSLLCISLIYPLTSLLGRVRIGAFARGVLPAQLVAVSTRSSLASLPAMIQGARAHLGLSSTATNALLPVNVSLFRISHVISNSVKLLFLANIFGVALRPATVVPFIVTVMILSFASSGMPNSGGGTSFRMVPVFLAAGIPTEGVILLEAVETIPDIFDTLSNVTGQVSAATILSRYSIAGRESLDPVTRQVPEPATETIL